MVCIVGMQNVEKLCFFLFFYFLSVSIVGTKGIFLRRKDKNMEIRQRNKQRSNKERGRKNVETTTKLSTNKDIDK